MNSFMFSDYITSIIRASFRLSLQLPLVLLGTLGRFYQKGLIQQLRTPECARQEVTIESMILYM